MTGNWTAMPVDGHDDAGAPHRPVAPEDLISIATSILAQAAVPDPAARVVAESLVESDLVGHDSHGVRRLTPYVSAIDEGRIEPAATPVVAAEQRATATIDGRHGLGQLAARLAVTRSLELSREYGVGMATIRNSGHIGRLGEYVQVLADSGAVGLAICNADPTVAPFGGRERRLGTNPLAWAAPRGTGEPPVIVDFATAGVAEGKLALAAGRGERVDEGLVVDAEGRQTTDPADFYRGGALLPFGLHKGYGLSVMIEIVAGLLSGAGISSLPDYDGTNGTVLVAIDIARFMPVARFHEQTRDFCRQLSESEPALSGTGRVLIPGEKEAMTRVQRLRDGIPLAEATWRELSVLPGGPADGEHSSTPGGS